MLLVSAAILAACLAIVVRIIRTNERAGTSDAAKTGEDEGVGGGEALALLRGSRHLQIIALVITFAAIGAAIIEQQLNMATAEAKGRANTDGITAFLAQVTVYLSLIGLFIQVALTSRIHRLLGIGFALMILPVSLGASAGLMLTVGALWTTGVARVLDTSLRYTVDKTTREILFLPLPADVKYRAKPFIDVTVDRLSKGAGALLILVLIKDWGFAPHLATAQLRQPDDHGAVGDLRAAGARGIHGGVPPEHRAAGHEGRRDSPRDGRPLHHRGAGRGTGAPRSEAGRSTRSICWNRSTSGTW